jgi:HSP20 family protein
MTRRWNPIGEMEQLRGEMARILEQARRSAGSADELRGSWTPPADVEAVEGGYRIAIDLPGIDPNEVEITVEKGVLTINGERKPVGDKADERERRHLERPSGCFCRSFHLPSDVDPTRIEAASQLGVLTLSLPTKEEKAPRSISVKVDE